MRYPTSEKLEIIRIVEQSHLPAKKTLDQLGIARRTFYRWYDRYLEGGPEALEDRPSRPIRVWNRISAEVQSQIVDMALEQSELSPRELAVRFTDEKRYFVSEATVYRLLKAHGLITSPAFVVIPVSDAVTRDGGVRQEIVVVAGGFARFLRTFCVWGVILKKHMKTTTYRPFVNFLRFLRFLR